MCVLLQVSRRVTFTGYATLAFAVSPALFVSLAYLLEYCSLAISENLLGLLFATLPHNYKLNGKRISWRNSPKEPRQYFVLNFSPWTFIYHWCILQDTSGVLKLIFHHH